ncbi:uncharacterized protein LOC132258308 isoform X1 [Phlebotomus argentipes]|uniref:uncharacterized protein LOC132258308 isoform X1 n=1 Tax=Phlebotomus argentipes TaxID=94469 RepID=UPI002892D5C2|nr:uncharacterized protein LOC132258308 isoform X1 [Phlebotomus argentipes]
MDYFDSVFVCIAIFCSILVFCVLCCNSGKEDSEVPIHHTDVVITSSSHAALRREGSTEFQPLSGNLERPIGFTAEVRGIDSPRPPNPPYPMDNLMPTPDSHIRAPSDHPPSPRDDINPPSYEQVMSNEAYYHHPSRN